jgi:hypothetical protein
MEDGRGPSAAVDFYAQRLRDVAPRTKLVPVAEEALIEAVAATVRGRLRDGRAASLPALAPELAHLVLLPYVGTGRAQPQEPVHAPLGTV